MKPFKEIVLILGFVLICLFLHDLWICISHCKSEDLFFPKLGENSCFILTFDRYIRDEEIISFECFEDLWHATGMYAEIVMFCHEECASSMKIAKLKPKKIAELEEKYGFSFFKNILKEEYYQKHQVSFTKAIISHTYYSSNRELWYDHYSKILLVKRSRGRH